MTRVVAASAWIGTCSHCLGIALHVTNVPLNAALLAVAIIEFGSLEYISWPTTVYLVALILLSGERHAAAPAAWQPQGLFDYRPSLRQRFPHLRSNT